MWYNLHICPAASSWSNLLLLCELVFSLPFSNGRMEQIFSSLKIIKTANRTSLSVSTLDNLLEIFVEGPPLDKFSADSAVGSWWSSCRTTRRVNQMPRKLYKLRVSDKPICLHESASESEEMHFALDDWDTLFGNTCSTVESDTGEDHKDSDVDEEDSDM